MEYEFKNDTEMERTIIIIFISVLFCFSCNSKRDFEGYWNISEIIIDNKNLNITRDINTCCGFGFINGRTNLPDHLFYENNMIRYSNNGDILIFTGENSIFIDTFKITTLNDTVLILENKTTFVKFIR